MSKINSLPKGLQEFLGNTAQGNNPSELLQDVRPGIDLFPYWGADKTKLIVKTGVVGAVGQLVAIPVPAGEVWIPLVASADVQCNALEPQRWRISMHITDSGGTARPTIAISDTITTAAPATEFVSCSHTFERVMLLPTGWFIIGIVEAYGGDAEVMSVDVAYIRLKA